MQGIGRGAVLRREFFSLSLDGDPSFRQVLLFGLVLARTLCCVLCVCVCVCVLGSAVPSLPFLTDFVDERYQPQARLLRAD